MVTLTRQLSQYANVVSFVTSNSNLLLANSIVFPDGTKLSTAAVSSSDTITSPSISSGVLTLDISLSSVFNITPNQNITSIVFTNLNVSTKVSTAILVINNTGTAYSIVWPASVEWPNGVAPTLTTTNGKKDIFTLFTSDGGTTWNAIISGQNI